MTPPSIDLARQHHWSGDLAAAADAYAAVMEGEPTSFAALAGLMLIAEATGDRDATRTLYGLLCQQPTQRATMEWMVAFFEKMGLTDRAAAIRLSLGAVVVPPCGDGSYRKSGRRLLIVCPNFVGGAKDAAMVRLWQEAIRRFNGDADWLMIFDGSPMAWQEDCGFDPSQAFLQLPDDGSLALRSRHTVAWYEKNIGHLHATGRDGWGRSLTTGLRAALSNGYDWVAHVESDMLTRADLQSMISCLIDHERYWGSARCPPWGFIESGLFLTSCGWLEQCEFIGRYDWSTTPLFPHQEWLFEAILGPSFDLPLIGGRMIMVKKDDPDHYNYVTMCRDVAHFRSYLDHWANARAI